MIKKTIKIGVYGASPYNPNKGVVALSYSCLYLLSQIERDNNLKINLFLIHGDDRPNDKEFITISDLKIQFTSIEPVNLSSYRSLIRFFISPSQWRALVCYKSLDYLLNVGGGDSFSDIYGLRRFKSINSQYHLARLLGIKAVVMPQTIGPFSNGKVIKLASRSLQKAEAILVRDKISLNHARGMTKRHIEELLDLAFFLPFKKHSFSSDYIHVGVNVSALCWNGGYTRDNQFGLKARYDEVIIDLINNLLLNPNIKVHLIPHVVLHQPNIENDYEISLQLWNMYNSDKVVCAPFFMDPIIAKSYISGLDFFTGARMHSLIAAFSAGVATLPMAYSRKFEGLFTTTLGYSTMCDLRIDSKSQILDKLNICLGRIESLKEEIAAINTNVVIERKNKLKSCLESILVPHVEDK